MEETTRNQHKNPIFQRKSVRFLTATSLPRVSSINFYSHSHKLDPNNEEKDDHNNFSTNIYHIDYLKMDLVNIHHRINENLDIIPYYKNPKSIKTNEKLVKRIKKIELIKEMNLTELLTSIKNKCENVNSILQEYSCQDNIELLRRLYFESKISELFIKRLNDLSVLINLKYNNPNCKFEKNFKNLNSSFEIISYIIDGLIQKKDNTELKVIKIKKFSMLETQKESFEFVASKINENSSFFFDASCRLPLSEYNGVEESKNKEEKFEEKTVIFSRNDYDSTEILNKSKFNLTKTKLRLDSGKLKTKRFNKSVLEKSLYYKKEDVESLKEELRNKDEMLNNYRNAIDNYNKTMLNFKDINEKRKIQLINEVKELTLKYERNEEKIKSLKNELETMRKLNLNFEKRIKSGDFTEYEIVLKDELNCLKNSFIKRIDELTTDIAVSKGEDKKTIKVLEDKLKESNQLLEYFKFQSAKS